MSTTGQATPEPQTQITTLRSLLLGAEDYLRCLRTALPELERLAEANPEDIEVRELVIAVVAAAYPEREGTPANIALRVAALLGLV